MNQPTRIAVSVALIPVELFRRVFRLRYRLDHTVCYVHPTEHWRIIAWGGTFYDSFTYAPNLRQDDGTKSEAAAIHDQGWVTGRKHNADLLTFDENNRAFRAVLDREGHPECVKNLYEWGVSLPRMRTLWRAKHGHE